MALRAGDRLPSINLLDQDGEQRSSDDLAGRPLVLFFYPKDDTPGCTIEACSFRDNHKALTELGAVVWGVSADDAVSHRRFANRHSLAYPLLCENLLDGPAHVRESLRVIRSLASTPAA